MTFSLPPELSAYINHSVAAGKFATPDEVVAAGLRLLQEQEHHDEWLAGEIRKGLDDIENGNFIELENEAAIRRFFADKKQRLRDRFETKPIS